MCFWYGYKSGSSISDRGMSGMFLDTVDSASTNDHLRPMWLCKRTFENAIVLKCSTSSRIRLLEGRYPNPCGSLTIKPSYYIPMAAHKFAPVILPSCSPIALRRFQYSWHSAFTSTRGWAFCALGQHPRWLPWLHLTVGCTCRCYTSERHRNVSWATDGSALPLRTAAVH